MEFIETKKPGFLSDGGRRASNGIVFAGLPVLDFLPVDVNAFMHVGHKLMKMHTAFAHHCAGLEEEVHEHRLATADLSVNVKPLERHTRLLALSEEPAKRR